MATRKVKKNPGIVAGIALNANKVESVKGTRKTPSKESDEKREKFHELGVTTKTLEPLFLEIFNKLSEVHSLYQEEVGKWEDETIAGKLAEVHSNVAYAHAAAKDNFPSYGKFTEQEMAIAKAILGLMDVASYEGLQVGEAMMEIINWNLYQTKLNA